VVFPTRNLHLRTAVNVRGRQAQVPRCQYVEPTL
jgi:hypothetical protein